MFNNFLVVLAFFILPPLVLPPFQTKPENFYIESWKKGQGCIQEKKFLVSLDTKKLNFKSIIKNCKGRDKYELYVQADKMKSGKIVSWNSFLLDVKAPTGVGSDLLTPYDYDPDKDSFSDKDYFGVFSPEIDPYIPIIPIFTKRIIKIENFYCILQVKSYDFNDIEKRYLCSINIEVQFTNVPPSDITK